MSSMRNFRNADIQYLFIFEDGQIGIHDTPPTEADRGMIEGGLLQVVKIQQSGHMNAGGEYHWPKVEGYSHLGYAYEIEESPLVTFEEQTFHTLET